MIKVRISEDALEDLDDGFFFYEAQEVGFGDYFAACLRADIERLKVSAGIHRVVYRDYDSCYIRSDRLIRRIPA